MKIKYLTIRKNDKYIVLEEALDENQEKILPFEFYIRKGDREKDQIISGFYDADILYDLIDKFLKENNA